ncbi:MAG: hypothetical protein KGN76_14675 [Acidobacteriota bacterium]|nr:hypothetical protein [Acidobacteriota bacterium]
MANWVALVGIVGGVAGLLTLAAYQTGVLGLVQIICFAVWGFATALSLLRIRQATSLVGSGTAEPVIQADGYAAAKVQC